MNKKCSKCGIEKSIDDFHKAKRGKFGVRGECKSCSSIYNLSYTISPEKRLQYRKTYERNNPMRYWVYTALKSHKRKGFLINVTPEFVYNLAVVSPHCFYCGSLLDYTTPRGKRNTVGLSNLPTIDRIDNGNNINEDNIRIICCRCNSTKYDRTELEFYNYCNKIVNMLRDKYKGEE